MSEPVKSTSADVGRSHRSGHWSAIHAIASVVALEALRGRMLWLMLALLLAGFAMAQFTAQVAITESTEIARGALAVWLRTASVFVVALFVLSSMLRDFSDKGMELVLALDLPRSVWLCGRLGGYAVMALTCAAVCTLALALFIPLPQALIWGITLLLELLLVVALSSLCLLTLTHVTLSMSAVAAFYLLARSMDAIRLMGSNPVFGRDSEVHSLMVWVLDAMAFVLPDLARFARSEWVIHGTATFADLSYAGVQAVIYLAVLIAASLFDLHRKVL